MFHRSSDFVLARFHMIAAYHTGAHRVHGVRRRRNKSAQVKCAPTKARNAKNPDKCTQDKSAQTVIFSDMMSCLGVVMTRYPTQTRFPTDRAVILEVEIEPELDATTNPY